MCAECYEISSELGQNFKPMLLHHSQQLQRHTARPLRARFPLLHGRLAGVQVAGEDGLADVVRLAQFFDLLWLDLCGLRETVFVEAAHGGFADGADFEQGACRCVDGFEGIGLEFRFGGGWFSGHGISP